MSDRSLDVSLVLRLIDELTRPAQRAKRELQDVGDAARRLDGASGEKLARDIASITGSAGKAKAEVDSLRQAAGRVDDTAGADRLANDLADVGRSADRAERQVDELREAARRLDDTSGADRLANDISVIAGTADRAERRVEELREAARRLDEANAAKKLADDLARVAEEGRRAGQELRQAREYADRLYRINDGPAVGGGPSRLRGGIQEAGREAAATVGGGFVPVGGPAVMTGAAIGGGILAGGMAGKYAAGQSISMEDAMGEIRKATGLTDPAELAAMEERILLQTRDKPLTKEAIAEIVAQAGYAGIGTLDDGGVDRNALFKFMDLAAKASVGFDMTAGAAGQQLSDIKNLFQFDLDKLGAAADTINYLSDRGGARESELLAFMQRAGGTGLNVGLNFDQLAAFGAAIESIGIRADVGANAFSNFANKMLTATSQPKKFAEGSALIDMTPQQIQNAMLADAPKAIMDILEKLKGLSKADRGAALTNMVGLEYADDISNFLAGLAVMKKNLGLITEDMSGSLDQTMAIKKDLSSAHLQDFQNAVEEAATALGDKFKPALIDAADWLTGALNDWTDQQRQDRKVEEISARQAAGQTLAPSQTEALINDPELARRVTRETSVKLTGQIRAKAGTDAGLTASEAREAETTIAELQARLAEAEGEINHIRSTTKSPEMADILAGRKEPEAEMLRQQIVDLEARLARPRDSGEPPPAPAPDAQATAIEDKIKAIENMRTALAAIAAPEDQAKVVAQIEAVMGDLKATAEGTDLTPAARKTLQDYAKAVTDQGPLVTDAARRIADELKALLDITLSPRIVPEGGGGVPVPRPRASRINYAPGEAAPAGASQRQASLGAPLTVHQTIHQTITGTADAEATGRAAARALDRETSRSFAAALHDLGSTA